MLRNERQRRLVRGRVENLSGRCRSSLGMTLTLRKNQGSRAIKGGAGSDMGSIQSAHAWRGLEGTTSACTRGPEQWPKVLAV